MSLSFEERLHVRDVRSQIQRRKEKRARRMHVEDLSGEQVYLGGGSRPLSEQIRSGYPASPTGDDSAWGRHARLTA